MLGVVLNVLAANVGESMDGVAAARPSLGKVGCKAGDWVDHCETVVCCRVVLHCRRAAAGI